MSIEGLIDTVANKPQHGYASGVRAKPFVKWAGGKRSIMPHLLSCMPNQDRFDKYYEPFVGGGAFFFGIESRVRTAYLSDMNAELMVAYKMIQTRLPEIIKALEYHHKLHDKRHFIAERKRYKQECPVGQAARFIYLNKTCFNGLYRVNSKGMFNAPMGAYKNPRIVDHENLNNVNLVLQEKAQLRWGSFEKIDPIAGDFVYCDPPYDETFDQYTQNRFNGKEHLSLSLLSNNWHKSGVKVMISNSDTDMIRQLYKAKHWHITSVEAPKTINCKASGRGKANELIITNYDPTARREG